LNIYKLKKVIISENPFYNLLVGYVLKKKRLYQSLRYKCTKFILTKLKFICNLKQNLY
jgi:hypothetical protein